MKIRLAVMSIAISLSASAAVAARQPEQQEPMAGQQMQLQTQAFSSALDGTWKIVEINHKPVTVATATLSFNAEKKTFATGAGCNSLFGGYRVRKRALSMEPPAITLMNCPGKEKAMALEMQISETIATVKSYRLKGENLLLRNRQGRTVLRAVR